MRIVSQDNNYDLNYDNVTLEITGDSVFAFTGTGQSFRIAKYSKREKCEKAMEMLHKSYLDTSTPNKLEMDKETAINLNYSANWVFFDKVPRQIPLLNKIWKFPDDDEVEVDDE